MRLLPLLIALLALAACAAPAPTPGSQETGTEVSEAASAPATQPPMRTGGPLPPERVHEGGSTETAAAVVVDTSCRTDADCTVKNIGNCCGYYPACVNINSPTDPKGVQERCMKEGRVSVCGFPSITACRCERGTCQAVTGSVIQ